MPVNLKPPDPAALLPVKGVSLGVGADTAPVMELAFHLRHNLQERDLLRLGHAVPGAGEADFHQNSVSEAMTSDPFVTTRRRDLSR